MSVFFFLVYFVLEPCFQGPVNIGLNCYIVILNCRRFGPPPFGPFLASTTRRPTRIRAFGLCIQVKIGHSSRMILLLRLSGLPIIEIMLGGDFSVFPKVCFIARTLRLCSSMGKPSRTISYRSTPCCTVKLAAAREISIIRAKYPLRTARLATLHLPEFFNGACRAGWALGFTIPFAMYLVPIPHAL